MTIPIKHNLNLRCEQYNRKQNWMLHHINAILYNRDDKKFHYIECMHLRIFEISPDSIC